MTRGALKETPHIKQPLWRCKCGDLVEQDEITAARHIAYVCRKATEEQRRSVLAIPGVAVEQPTQEQVAQSRERRQDRARRNRIRQRQRGRG